MKKYLIAIICLLVVTGCDEEKEKENIIVKSNVESGSWTNGCETITVEAENINDYSYSFDEGLTWLQLNTIEVCENKVLNIKIKDGENKIVSEQTYEIKSIDKTKPLIVLNPTVQLNTGKVVNVSELAQASDADSGVGTITCTPATIDGTKEGTFASTCEVIDKAGNKSSATTKITLLEEKLTLSKTKATILKGKTTTIKATVKNNENQTITWSSSDNNVATVANGVITGVNEGTATISAKSSTGKEVSCIVTVINEIVATSISINTTNELMDVGTSKTLTATISPSNTTNKTVTWTSSDPNIAIVANGVVTAVSVGKATITAKTNNGKTAVVTIDSQILPNKVVIAEEYSEGFPCGGELPVKIYPENATNQTITWTSSDDSIVSVDQNGMYRYSSTGDVTITATTFNGVKDTYDIKVTEEMIWKCKNIMTPVAKPILYLYPTKTTNVSVQITKPNLLITTYPKYNNGWNVIAHPNGDLYDMNNKYYYALYWDEENINKVDFSTGFYVTKENAIKFLEEKLPIIGLNDRERNEFIMYWLPIIEKNEKNLIYFELTKERENNNKIIINPAPDSLLRIVIHIKKVEKETNIKEQTLETFKRTGFVAVEWGGVKY